MALNFQADFWKATKIRGHSIPGIESGLYDVCKGGRGEK